MAWHAALTSRCFFKAILVSLLSVLTWGSDGWLSIWAETRTTTTASLACKGCKACSSPPPTIRQNCIYVLQGRSPFTLRANLQRPASSGNVLVTAAAEYMYAAGGTGDVCLLYRTNDAGSRPRIVCKLQGTV